MSYKYKNKDISTIIAGYNNNKRSEPFIGFPLGTVSTSNLLKPTDFGYKDSNGTDLSNQYVAHYHENYNSENKSIPADVKELRVFLVGGGDGGGGGSGSESGYNLASVTYRANGWFDPVYRTRGDGGLAYNGAPNGATGYTGTNGIKSYYTIPITNETNYNINIGQGGSGGSGGSGGYFNATAQQINDTPANYNNINWTQYAIVGANNGNSGTSGNNTTMNIGGSSYTSTNNAQLPSSSPSFNDYGRGGGGGSGGQGDGGGGGSGGQGNNGYCRVYFIYK